MLYHPDMMVFIWLLPVIFLVLVPAALATCRFVIGCMKENPGEDIETYSILDQEAIAEA